MRILKVTHQGAARDAAGVRLGPSVRGPIHLCCYFPLLAVGAYSDDAAKMSRKTSVYGGP